MTVAGRLIRPGGKFTDARVRVLGKRDGPETSNFGPLALSQLPGGQSEVRGAVEGRLGQRVCAVLVWRSPRDL